MDMNLQGRRVIVTGGSSGIGLAIATELANHGAAVVSISRGETAELAALIASSTVTAVHADLTNPAQAETAVADAVANLGGLDILINNTGGVSGREGFLGFTDEDWLQTFDLNVMTVVRSIRAALSALRDGGGAVVNVASVNARQPSPGIAD